MTKREFKTKASELFSWKEKEELEEKRKKNKGNQKDLNKFVEV